MLHLTNPQYFQYNSVPKSKKLTTLKLFFSIESKKLFSTTILFLKQITFFFKWFCRGKPGVAPVNPLAGGAG